MSAVGSRLCENALEKVLPVRTGMKILFLRKCPVCGFTKRSQISRSNADFKTAHASTESLGRFLLSKDRNRPNSCHSQRVANVPKQTLA